MQFLILFPFPSPASIPRCLINTRELCFPSLPRHGGCQPAPPVRWGPPPSPPALLGALGRLGVRLAGAGPMSLARTRASVSLSRLSACTITGIASLA